MLGVKVIYRYFWQLDRNGYWFDSSDGKLTLRNSENSPLFEVIHDPQHSREHSYDKGECLLHIRN